MADAICRIKLFRRLQQQRPRALRTKRNHPTTHHIRWNGDREHGTNKDKPPPVSEPSSPCGHLNVLSLKVAYFVHNETDRLFSVLRHPVRCRGPPASEILISQNFRRKDGLPYGKTVL